MIVPPVLERSLWGAALAAPPAAVRHDPPLAAPKSVPLSCHSRRAVDSMDAGSMQGKSSPSGREVPLCAERVIDVSGVS